MSQKLLLLITLVLASSCGINEDRFACADLCNESRRCFPAMSDEEWDDCYFSCDESQTPVELIDCVVDQNCRNNMDTMLKNCYFDPLNND